MELSLKSTINLNNDVKMPLLGLRVYKMKGGEETYKTVRDALDVGYRLIDTARIYCNEKSVGRGIKDSLLLSFGLLTLIIQDRLF